MNLKFKGNEIFLIRYGLLKGVENHCIEEEMLKSTITRIELWKVPLCELLPSDFGLFYHAYLILETKRLLEGETIPKDGPLYWALEKNRKQINLQLSHGRSNVVEMFCLKRRLSGNYWEPQKLDEYTFDSKMEMSKIFSHYVKSGHGRLYLGSDRIRVLAAGAGFSRI